MKERTCQVIWCAGIQYNNTKHIPRENGFLWRLNSGGVRLPNFCNKGRRQSEHCICLRLGEYQWGFEGEIKPLLFYLFTMTWTLLWKGTYYLVSLVTSMVRKKTPICLNALKWIDWQDDQHNLIKLTHHSDRNRVRGVLSFEVEGCTCIVAAVVSLNTLQNKIFSTSKDSNSCFWILINAKTLKM